MSRIQIFLSRRWTGFVFTILSILVSNCWQQILPNFDVDNTYCIAAAKNISEGHGYSIKMASTEDFSKFYFKPLNKWPPGNSWLLWLVHRIFNTDWIYTTYILNALGLTALILLFRKMLFQLEFPAWLVNPSVLFFGAFQFTFHYSNNSDLLGLLFYLAALSAILNAVKSERNLTPMIWLAGILLGCSAFIKYLYIPLAFVPFLSLLIYGYVINRKDFRSPAIKGLVILFFMILSLLLFQFLNSGNSLYVNPSKTGFFPEQILWLAPVIPASLMNINFLDVQISMHSPIRYEMMGIFWSMVNVFCIGWLFYTCYRLWWSKLLKVRNFKSFYFIHAVLFTAALFGFLSLLSVTKSKSYTDSFSLWVYAGEIRYYAVFSVLLLQFVMLIFLHPEYFFNKSGKIIFRCLIIFIAIEEISHGTYFITKTALIKKKYGIDPHTDQFSIKKIFLAKGGITQANNLVFCSNSQGVSNMAAIEGLPVLYELGKLRKPIPSSQPITLIIAVDKRVPNSVVPMFSSRMDSPYYVVDSVKFFIVNLPKTTHF